MFTYPQVKIYEGKVDATKTVDQIINEITPSWFKEDLAERQLIVDRNQNFHRIAKDDPINRHYNGRLGEMFRITDGSAVRYRIVSPPVAMSKNKDKPKEKRVTASIYASAYENVLTMLEDRGCDPSILSRFSIPRDQLVAHFQGGTIQNLTVPGLESDDPQLIDSRGRAIYVFFQSPEDDIIISRRGSKFREDLLMMMSEVIKHHNKLNPGDPVSPFDVEDLSDPKTVETFSSRFEIVIVYNNPLSKTEYSSGIKPKFYQAFPVQNLSFVVTRHIDQPHFTLLDAKVDRKEIHNMYAQNGRTLEGDKTLESYTLRDNVRLMLL